MTEDSGPIPQPLAGADDKLPPVFCQMNVLRKYGNNFEWQEAARWIKYEENVEEAGKRWSKPHVASLSMKALTELRFLLKSASVNLDVEEYSMSEITETVLAEWRSSHILSQEAGSRLRDILQARHKHLHTKRSDMGGATSGGNRNTSEKNENSQFAKSKNESVESLSSQRRNASLCKVKSNDNFMRKIPKGSEVTNILIGEMPGLYSPLVAFIRLIKARILGDLTEVQLPTRFLFFLLGPRGRLDSYYEMGRCLGTLMSDKSFNKIAFKCDCKKNLMSGLDNFVDASTLLPPGGWDPKIRLDPPVLPPANMNITEEKGFTSPIKCSVDAAGITAHDDPALQRTGKFFGGLREDVKRKLKWYLSDFKDCCHVQCLATTIYLFLATLTPNVTFGGLLGQATDQYMATMECIFAAAVSGVIFALFAGQPLNILGSTGPMLVVEMILFQFCRDYGWDFLVFRVWIGLWTALLLLIIVAFDLSTLVRYITRFTEETFACLIALIFIYEAFGKLLEIAADYPIHLHAAASPINQSAEGGPALVVSSSSSHPGTAQSFLKRFTEKETAVEASSSLHLCDASVYVPDVFLLSVLLFLGTFGTAWALEKCRTSRFFPSCVRRTVSNFGVLIAVLCMIGVDIGLGLDTPKLTVPSKFQPTRSDRGWLINPLISKNPWWLPLAGLLPAVLATVLIFMDQQITAVIVNRKEHKLKKGGGYHLDLLVLAVLITVCSVFGLPWYVAATVSAIAHLNSLKWESECTAPGEQPVFLGVREQRFTALMVGLLNGLSILFTSVLKYIPMPVLYGVFLYMGVAALNGMQLIDRILILFKPQKYQPDFPYLRNVPLWRVHLFTFIQVLCLVILWIVKSMKNISLIFPVMVLAICFTRKILDYIFTQRELAWLDTILPGVRNKEEKCQIREEANNQAFVMEITSPDDSLSDFSMNPLRSLPENNNMQRTEPDIIHQNISQVAENNDFMQSDIICNSKL